MTIEIKKQVHPVWEEWQQIDQTNYMRKESLVGQYQYILSNVKGDKISLVELPNYFNDGITLWEIFCMNGDLFEDVERFGSYDEAVEQAKKYLGEERE